MIEHWFPARSTLGLLDRPIRQEQAHWNDMVRDSVDYLLQAERLNGKVKECLYEDNLENRIKTHLLTMQFRSSKEWRPHDIATSCQPKCPMIEMKPREVPSCNPRSSIQQGMHSPLKFDEEI